MRIVSPFFTVLLFAFLIGCTRNPAGTTPGGPARISLNLYIIKPAAKSAAVAETRYDSLVVRVSAPDMTTTILRFPLPNGTQLFTDTLDNIPAGSNRLVELWTKNTADSTIHRASSQTVTLSPGELKTLSFILNPLCGSIYVQLGDVPTTVDSVYVRFVSDNGAVVRTAAVKRDPKLNVSLDYIPENTTGTVYIAALNAAKDTLYRSQTRLTFRVAQNTTIPAGFSSAPGGLSMDVSIVKPGVTVIAGEMGSGDTVGTERGPLIISEIMYMANDSEYIELHNPTATDTTLDTLILNIDTGPNRIFTNVTVTAGGFLVIGCKSLPWAQRWHNVASALALSSTTGNWITLRTKTMRVIDWVAFDVKSNTLGWPNIPSAKASIVLDSLPADPSYNNYGTHWKTAVSRIDATATPVTAQLGTPGRMGI